MKSFFISHYVLLQIFHQDQPPKLTPWLSVTPVAVLSITSLCCVTADLVPGTATPEVYGYMVTLCESFCGHTEK